MTDEADVLAVSAGWDAALIANDAPGFAGFVTTDWVYVGSGGATSATEIIGSIASGRLVHHVMRTIGVPRVVVHGDAAIVTARKASSGTWDGLAYAADEWISEVFVRQGGRWRCVLSQKCPAKSAPPATTG
jgi:ketosteroid isomerase-like protein